jgi:hypothetical protein
LRSALTKDVAYDHQTGGNPNARLKGRPSLIIELLDRFDNADPARTARSASSGITAVSGAATKMAHSITSSACWRKSGRRDPILPFHQRPIAWTIRPQQHWPAAIAGSSVRS